MPNITDQVAAVLYDPESQYLPWEKALVEDRNYYTSLADLAIDVIVERLRLLDTDAFAPAIEFLAVESERARQARLA